MKTKFSSYCINGIANGCKFCVKGEKLVLFITGKCPRNCYYCSLSSKRKNKDIVWANERVCKNANDAVEEAVESNAKGAGITGGDPLFVLNRTLNYSKALKKKFGKKFHIHIYLPTNLVTMEKLKKLSNFIDEIRFHPRFLSMNINEKDVENDINKIKSANNYWKKQNIGIEMPSFPDRKKEIFDFIKKVSPFIGFVNLNELEISDTNFDYMTKHYKLKKGGYVVSGSKEAGSWILEQCKKENSKLNIHLCTAETKNRFQYTNRLRRHKIMPFGEKTKQGSVMYLVISPKDKDEEKKIRALSKEVYYDSKKKRFILSKKAAIKLLDKHKITKIEELPTYDNQEIYSEEIV